MKTFQPKILTTLKHYSAKQLTSDLVAGIIVAIIALPLSIALAIASGVSPEQGLYTAIVAGFVIALFGGSRVNISGPTAAFATIVEITSSEIITLPPAWTWVMYCLFSAMEIPPNLVARIARHTFVYHTTIPAKLQLFSA